MGSNEAVPTRTLMLGIALMAPLLAFLANQKLRQPLILGRMMPFFLLSEDTVYAPGFTEWGFRNVRVGMTEAEARRRLGPPLLVGVTLALDPKTAPNRYWPKETLTFEGTPSALKRWYAIPPVSEMPSAIAGRTLLQKQFVYSAHRTDGNGDHYVRNIEFDPEGKVRKVESGIWLD